MQAGRRPVRRWAVEAAGLRKAGTPSPPPATFPQPLEIRFADFHSSHSPDGGETDQSTGGGIFSCELRGKFGCELTCDARVGP